MFKAVILAGPGHSLQDNQSEYAFHPPKAVLRIYLCGDQLLHEHIVFGILPLERMFFIWQVRTWDRGWSFNILFPYRTM